MNQYLFNIKIADLEKQVEEVKDILARIEDRIAIEEELWDNADLIRNFKISARTLADWRSKKLIGYSQINGKIYYSVDDRRNFINSNHI